MEADGRAAAYDRDTAEQMDNIFRVYLSRGSLLQPNDIVFIIS